MASGYTERMKPALLLGCLLLGSSSALADVLDSTPGGFTVKTVVEVAAPSARVYLAQYVSTH